MKTIQSPSSVVWRRGSESNRRIKVLQTSPLPLGYRANLGWKLTFLSAVWRAHSSLAVRERTLRVQRPLSHPFSDAQWVQSLRPIGACRPVDGSKLERETGLEPATLALARRCSTTELLPHGASGSIAIARAGGQRRCGCGYAPAPASSPT